MVCNKTELLFRMAEKNLNHRSLAKSTGLSNQTVTRILRGENAKGTTFKKIADVLDCNIRDIVSEV